MGDVLPFRHRDERALERRVAEARARHPAGSARRPLTETEQAAVDECVRQLGGYPLLTPRE